MPSSYPFPCSPQAAVRIIPDAVDNVGVQPNLREKYPYSNLPIGYCFTIPLNEVANEQSLRNAVSQKGRTLNKKFCVVKHLEPNNCYEVARIG